MVNPKRTQNPEATCGGCEYLGPECVHKQDRYLCLGSPFSASHDTVWQNMAACGLHQDFFLPERGISPVLLAKIEEIAQMIIAAQRAMDEEESDA